MGFRLQELTTRRPAQTPLRDVLYRDYDANGYVTAIHDQLNSASSPLSLTQRATYDNASRLTRAVQCGGGRYEGVFDQDQYGNLKTKEGASYAYGSDGPHQVSAVDATDLGYDRDGNATQLPGNRSLVYDAEGRLVRVDRGGVTIARYLYDYTGRRVAARSPEGTRISFGPFDWHDGKVTRYFRTGDRLIAASTVNDSLLAALPPSRGSVMVAQLVGGVPALAMIGLGIALVGRRPRRFGVRGRWSRRPVVLLALAVYVAQLPSLPEAAAQCPTLGPPPAGTLFYHVDHLGSPQLLTNELGQVVEHLVYRPYGAVGAVYDGTGAQLDQSISPFLFTGHRADDGTGLVYMGARYYDVALGLFVSQDPARQFANPYSYGAGNPLNGRDPTGAFFDAIVWGIIIGALLGGLASGIQAAVNGASVGEALTAAVIGAAEGAALGAVGGIVGGAVKAAGSTALSAAFLAVTTGYAVYSGYSSIQSGQYATGALALLLAAVAIAGAAGSSLQSGSGEVASGGAEQTGVQLAENANAAVVNDAGPQFGVGGEPPWMGVDELQPADVLTTLDNGNSVLASGGVAGHAASVYQVNGQRVTELTSEPGTGPALLTNTGANGGAVGGRAWTVYRPQGVDPAAFQQAASTIAKQGGSYFGQYGGNVCSSVAERAVTYAGGPAVKPMLLNIVTPNQLAAAYGPPIGRVYIPRLQ